MFRCDLCGKKIYRRDFDLGAVKSVHDQPETDTLCIECNKENNKDDNELTQKHARD
jgi:ribosomal 30S subunit maturation factor RimM